jgi:pyrimidine deaminase RibD-like protein
MLNERELMIRAIDEARRSRDEDDGRVHPRVGGVVVKGEEIIGAAHRGEQAPGEHAEFTCLEKKLRDHDLSSATVYTTLEPCTSRNDPKVPCAKRLVERRVDRVVIGMLDPNQEIRGPGEWPSLSTTSRLVVSTQN